MKKNNKGFTLAELLIVVAIIAVLVAIAIPVFTTQLEKSRDAVSVSNMRAAYAEAQTALLSATASGETVGKATVTMNAKKQVTSVAVTDVALKSQQANEWSKLDTDLPFTAPNDEGGYTGTKTITFTYTYDDNNNISAITAALS